MQAADGEHRSAGRLKQAGKINRRAEDTGDPSPRVVLLLTCWSTDAVTVGLLDLNFSLLGDGCD